MEKTAEETVIHSAKVYARVRTAIPKEKKNDYSKLCLSGLFDFLENFFYRSIFDD